ncbi:hypothetical protein BH10PLA1_BH10PLA1_00540 [soil metagenome]
MPPTDHTGPIVLTSLPNEIVASLLVGLLENDGIRAELSGVLTSAFRAEAPGEVQVLVLPADLARAREVLEDWQKKGNG